MRQHCLAAILAAAFALTLGLIALGILMQGLPADTALTWDALAARPLVMVVCSAAALISALEFFQAEKIREALDAKARLRAGFLILVGVGLALSNGYFTDKGAAHALESVGAWEPAREIAAERSPEHDRLDELAAAHLALGRVDWSSPESIKTAQRLANFHCAAGLAVDGKSLPGGATEAAIPSCRRSLEGALAPLRARVAAAEAPLIVPAQHEWRVHLLAAVLWLLFTFGRWGYLAPLPERRGSGSGELSPAAEDVSGELSPVSVGVIPISEAEPEPDPPPATAAPAPSDNVIPLRRSYSAAEWREECARRGHEPPPPPDTQWRYDLDNPRQPRVYAYPIRVARAKAA